METCPVSRYLPNFPACCVRIRAESYDLSVWRNGKVVNSRQGRQDLSWVFSVGVSDHQVLLVRVHELFPVRRPHSAFGFYTSDAVRRPPLNGKSPESHFCVSHNEGAYQDLRQVPRNVQDLHIEARKD